MKTYDVIVIGTGAANIVVDAAARQGLRIAQIERSHFGGTCLNRGCIPTKVMVTAADYVREITEASVIGIETSDVHVNWDQLSKRVWDKIGENTGVKSYYGAMDNVDIYEGTGFFTDKNVIQVQMQDGTLSEMLTADKIILGVGARTTIPRLSGLDTTDYITSESFFGSAFPQKPYESLIIVGGGAIGCEFAHVFSALGTKVTLIQHNKRLLPKEDEEISAHLLQELQRLGITIHVDQDTVRVRQENGQKILTFRNITTGEEQEVSAEALLIAPGITPMTDLLHLECTDVQTDKKGFIQTNEFLETSADGIWALGDVNGTAPFRHKANYEADIIAHNLFSGYAPSDWRWARYDNVPAVTYTFPQTAHVGLTEKQAIAAGYAVKTAKNRFSYTAKGYALGYRTGAPNDGFVKIVVDKWTNKMLGMHITGPQASVLIQPFVSLMNAGRTTLQPIHEEIASPIVRQLRAGGLTREMDPRSVLTVGETMTPHPSLTEVAMWTQYYYEGK